MKNKIIKVDKEQGLVKLNYYGYYGFILYIRELMIYKYSTKNDLLFIPKLISYKKMELTLEFINQHNDYFNKEKLAKSLVNFQNIAIKTINFTYLFSLKDIYVYFLNSYTGGVFFEFLFRGLGFKTAIYLILRRPKISQRMGLLVHNDLRSFQTGNVLYNENGCYLIDFESVKYEKWIFYDYLLLSYDFELDSFDNHFLSEVMINLQGTLFSIDESTLKELVFGSLIKVGIRYFRKNRSQEFLLKILNGHYNDIIDLASLKSI